jgi:hypothetical protein
MAKTKSVSETESSTGVDEHGRIPFVLWAAVVVMGIALVAGIAIVFSTIIYRMVKPGPAQTARPAGKPALMDIAVGRGEIKHIALDNNRVAIHTDEEIIVVDIKHRRIISRIRLRAGN